MRYSVLYSTLNQLNIFLFILFFKGLIYHLNQFHDSLMGCPQFKNNQISCVAVPEKCKSKPQ